MTSDQFVDRLFKAAETDETARWAIAALQVCREENATLMRLLGKLEWSGGGNEGPQCPACGQFKPLNDGLVYAVGVEPAGLGHKPDCELAAELRAAGVLP